MPTKPSPTAGLPPTASEKGRRAQLKRPRSFTDLAPELQLKIWHYAAIAVSYPFSFQICLLLMPGRRHLDTKMADGKLVHELHTFESDLELTGIGYGPNGLTALSTVCPGGKHEAEKVLRNRCPDEFEVRTSSGVPGHFHGQRVLIKCDAAGGNSSSCRSRPATY